MPLVLTSSDASAVSLLKIACPEVYIRVHFWTRVFAEQKRRRWMKPRGCLKSWLLFRHPEDETEGGMYAGEYR